MKKPGKRKSAAAARRSRPQLCRIAEEMKEWAALLGAEMERWPGVRTKAMFGLLAFYRGKQIFAAVPRTRALNTPHSVIFKLAGAGAAVARRARQDPRVKASAMGAAKWLAIEIHSARDLGAALQWLDRAYRCAA
ncbi:MAG: hypothetical protein ACRD2R_07710 [Terriglobales bacterium]